MSGLVKKLLNVKNSPESSSSSINEFNEEIEGLRKKLELKQDEIKGLEAKIKELNGRIDLSKLKEGAINRPADTNGQVRNLKDVNSEETLTVRGLNVNDSNYDAFSSHMEVIENHQEDDYVSRDFDQQDEIHFVIEKFEVKESEII